MTNYSMALAAASAEPTKLANAISDRASPSAVANILPPNATPLEKAVSITGRERIAAVPVPLDSLFDPMRCPVSHLPWLAWAVSVDVWDDAWPESVKRQAIAGSVEVHRRKGTVGSLRRALAAQGYQVKILEHAALDAAWTEGGGWRLDGTVPLDGSHTLSATTDGFWTMTRHWAEYALDLDISSAMFDAKTPETISRIANATAPARSHLVALRFRAVYQADCGIHIRNPKTTILISLTGERALQVPQFDTLRQLAPLGGDTIPATLTSALRLDGSWPIGGMVPGGQPLEAGIGTPSLTAVVTPLRFGCGGDRATPHTLGGMRYDPHSGQMIPLVLDGTWGLGGETSPETGGIWGKFIIREIAL